MYFKLAFDEKTQTGCMNLSLIYFLKEQPTIVATLPEQALVNKQVRQSKEHSLDEMFGLANACEYEVYMDCDIQDITICNKVLEAFAAAHQGKLPCAEANHRYFNQGENIIVNSFKFLLAAAKTNPDLDSEALQTLVKQKMAEESEQEGDDMLQLLVTLATDPNLPSKDKEDMSQFLASLVDEPELSEEARSTITSVLPSTMFGQTSASQQVSKKQSNPSNNCSLNN